MPERKIEVIITGVNKSSPAFAELNGHLARVGSNVITADRAMGGFKSSLGQVEGAAQKASGGLGGLIGGLGKLGMGVFGIQQITQAVGGMAAGFISGNKELENAQAQFNAFTKDAAVSKNMIAALRAEADKTPFAFQEMANAGASLIPSAKAANV